MEYVREWFLGKTKNDLIATITYNNNSYKNLKQQNK